MTSSPGVTNKVLNFLEHQFNFSDIYNVYTKYLGLLREELGTNKIKGHHESPNCAFILSG